MNKSEARKLMADIEAAVKPVLDTYGMDLAKFRAGYADSSVRLTITGQARGADSPEVVDWHRYADSYGLEADWLGAEMQYNGKRYRVTGLATSRRTYPVAVTELATGRPYFLTIAAAKSALAV